MPKAVSPVVKGLEIFEYVAGGPAAGQSQYNPLPILMGNGIVTSRWHFTAEERRQIAAGADVLISLSTGGLVPPQRLLLAMPNADPGAMANELGLINLESGHDS